MYAFQCTNRTDFIAYHCCFLSLHLLNPAKCGLETLESNKKNVFKTTITDIDKIGTIIDMGNFFFF